MSTIVYQGTITTTGSTRIPCTSGRLLITSIIINNLTLPYSITVSKFLNNGQSIPLYQFDLDAGDSVRDTEDYLLNTGDLIEILTDVAGGTYYVSAMTVS